MKAKERFRVVIVKASTGKEVARVGTKTWGTKDGPQAYADANNVLVKPQEDVRYEVRKQ